MKALADADWAGILHSGMRVFPGSGAGVPQALIESFLRAAPAFRDLEVVHIHTLGPAGWIDPAYEGILRTNSFFLTREVRAAVAEGRADYTPCPLSEVPGLLGGALRPDLALVMVSPPQDGYCSLGVSVDVAAAAVAAAREVIAQVNPRMPFTAGESRIPVDRIDWMIEREQELPELEPVTSDPVREKIGAYLAQLIEDGSTLQVGLGNTARAVVSALRDHRHLGIHTGMIGDELIDLIRCGAVDNSRKGFHAGVSVCSHVLGSQAAYEFVRENRELEFHPTAWVNDPRVIARNDRMVSINGALRIDLTGQVVRDSRGHMFHGGVGAQLDFVRGAAMSPHGRPVVVLPSTSADGRRSRVVADLEPGTGIATGRTDVHFVITEYGIARLHGRSIRERVVELVQVAHPDFREDLLRGARTWGWVPKLFSMAPTAMRDGTGAHGIESRRLELGGRAFVLRPLHPADLRLLQEFFYSHDPETVRQRYGYARDSMTEESAYRLVAVNQNQDLALAVIEEADGAEAIRAIGRYYLDEGGKAAEVAFVVHEKSRRLGMARVLLEAMAEVAARRKVPEFWASVLRENRAMAALLQDYGARLLPGADQSAREFRVDVAAIVACAAQARERRKPACETEAADSSPTRVPLAFVCDGVFEGHDTGPGHPESPGRYRAVWEALRPLADEPDVHPVPPREATIAELARCHNPSYIDLVRWDCQSLASQLRTGDTQICEESFRIARLASGAVIDATEAVCRGRVKRAFCAVRPPGHHASQARGMGFCIFNHIALAARHAQKACGLERVLIIDWDVHHGNGTQDIFDEDPSVFFFSTHEQGIYPGTGHATERGRGAGHGFTLNIPLPAHTTGELARRAITGHLLPEMERFRPQLVLVSAGFDARINDPIGSLAWTDEDFAGLTRDVCALANQYADGRVVAILEGGYNPAGLASAVRAHVAALREP